jgi:hypothetical protein
LNSSSALPGGRDTTRRLCQTLFVAGAFLFLAVRLFRQVSRYAVNIFYSDQWDFNDATLFQKHSLWEMFRWQHGPHRQGVGALLSKLVEPHFQWNSRVEAFLATGIVVIAALCALYLKTRLWGPLSFSDIAIPLIFFTPAQYENLWLTPNFSHGPLPLLLAVLYCLALTCERAVIRYSLALIVNFLAIYTGFALFLGVITPVWLLLDYFLRRRAGQPSNYVLIALALSFLSLASFSAGYRFESAADCFSVQPRSAVDYLVFINLMLAHFFGARGSRFFVSIPLGGMILVVMVLVLVSFGKRVRQSKNYTPKDLIPAVLVGYCLLFCAANAYGRTCFGRGMAFSSRYTEYIEVGVLGLYLQALSASAKWAQRTLSGLVVAMLLVGSFPIPPADRYAMQYFHNIKANWRSCYIRFEDIRRCDQATGLGVFQFPERTKLKEKLDYLKQTRQNLYSDLK